MIKCFGITISGFSNRYNFKSEPFLCGNILKCPIAFIFFKRKGNISGTADFSIIQRSILSAGDNLFNIFLTALSRQTQFRRVTLFKSRVSGALSLHLKINTRIKEKKL